MNSEAADGATTLNKAPTDTPSEAAPNELPLTLSIRDVRFTPESGHRSVGLA
jgi:hypothetical protein